MFGNYKIRVNNEAESTEAQELFKELSGCIDSNDRFGIVCLTDGKIYTDKVEFFEGYDDCEDITLPKLRDIVAQSKPTEQGLISGVEAFNANMTGECVLWRYKENDWQEWTDITAWSKSALTDSNYSFKIKPNTVKIEIEIPAPFEPKCGDEVYFIDCDTKRGYSSDIIGQGCDPEWIQFGAWKSEDEIKQVVAALRSALTSK